jgi:hypothetical protein
MPRDLGNNSPMKNSFRPLNDYPGIRPPGLCRIM